SGRKHGEFYPAHVAAAPPCRRRTALSRWVRPIGAEFDWAVHCSMLRAFLGRALAGLAVVVGVVTLMFFLLRLAPGDPALLLVGPTATEEQVAAQRQSLGL